MFSKELKRAIDGQPLVGSSLGCALDEYDEYAVRPGYTSKDAVITTLRFGRHDVRMIETAESVEALGDLLSAMQKLTPFLRETGV